MRRDAFEHVIRAAADVAQDEIVVIGSQAILAQHPDAPDALLTSLELDIYPKNHPERAERIDGALGDGSRFHETFGYYAHGVGPENAIAPAGWETRLVRVDVPAARRAGRTVTAWCIEAHDLVVAKLAAGRPHDRAFVMGALRAGLVDVERLRLGVGLMPASHRAVTGARLEGIIARLTR